MATQPRGSPAKYTRAHGQPTSSKSSAGVKQGGLQKSSSTAPGWLHLKFFCSGERKCDVPLQQKGKLDDLRSVVIFRDLVRFFWGGEKSALGLPLDMHEGLTEGTHVHFGVLNLAVSLPWQSTLGPVGKLEPGLAGERNGE